MNKGKRDMMYRTAKAYIAAYPVDHRYRTTERGRKILGAVVRAAYKVSPVYVERLFRSLSGGAKWTDDDG